MVDFGQVGVLEVLEASASGQVAGQTLLVVDVSFFVEHQILVRRLGEVVNCYFAEKGVVLLADLLDPVGYGGLH